MGEENVKRDKIAIAIILRVLPEGLLMQVITKESPKEVWDSVKIRFIGADRVQQACLKALQNEFTGLKMRDVATVDDFAGRLNSICSQYRELGSTLEDEIMMWKMLNSMPDKFIHLIVGIEKLCDLTTTSFEEMVERLKAFEE